MQEDHFQKQPPIMCIQALILSDQAPAAVATAAGPASTTTAASVGSTGIQMSDILQQAIQEVVVTAAGDEDEDEDGGAGGGISTATAAESGEESLTFYDHGATLELTPESARALGFKVDAAGGDVRHSRGHLQGHFKARNVVESSAAVIRNTEAFNRNVFLFPEEQQQQHRVLHHGRQGQSPVYLVRQAINPVATSPGVSTVMGMDSSNPTTASLLTNVLRPVMATGVKVQPAASASSVVVSSTSSSPALMVGHRQHPVILPKLPAIATSSVGGPPILLATSNPAGRRVQGAVGKTRQHQQHPGRRSQALILPAPSAVVRQGNQYRHNPAATTTIVITTANPVVASSASSGQQMPSSIAAAAAVRDGGRFGGFVDGAGVAAAAAAVGTAQNPIQIVQEGKTYRSLQPLSHQQVTRIANVLKETRPDFGAEKDRRIVYVNKEDNTRTEYKIVYPEDVLPLSSEGTDAGGADKEDLEEDPIQQLQQQHLSYASLREPVYLSPQELMLFDKRTLGEAKGGGSRKRGRPTGIERFFNLRNLQKNAKKLRKDFGFSSETAKKLQNEIVDEATLDLLEKARQAERGLLNGGGGDLYDDDDDDEDRTAGEALDEAGNYVRKSSPSVTRYGRMSRPPIPIDEEFKHLRRPGPALSSAAGPLLNGGSSSGLGVDEHIVGADAEQRRSPLLHPAQAPPTRVKRQFNVPPRFRCRVCNKIYLGDRKMNNHMKNFPGHGPIITSEANKVASSSSMASCPQTMVDGKILAHQQQQTMAPSLVMAPATAVPLIPNVPIIPLARTQLEDLVKNLDAELVLDVVSKKMFDNFSLWELQMKKASLSSEKGLKVLNKLFDDVESVLAELKKLVDHCLTDTKLSDKATHSISMGENLQLALNGHEGPWYLEQVHHVPQEYHKFFGIEPPVMASMVSPRSEESSNNVLTMHPAEMALMDENTSSLMSSASDKDPLSMADARRRRSVVVAADSVSGEDLGSAGAGEVGGSGDDGGGGGGGGGAQMVLEQNLGVASLDADDDDDEDDGDDDGVGEDSTMNADVPSSGRNFGDVVGKPSIGGLETGKASAGSPPECLMEEGNSSKLDEIDDEEVEDDEDVEVEDGEEEEEEVEDEDEDDEDGGGGFGGDFAPDQEMIDPKEVLKLNGISVSSADDAEDEKCPPNIGSVLAATSASTAAAADIEEEEEEQQQLLEASTSDLAREIDSLLPPIIHEVDDASVKARAADSSAMGPEDKGSAAPALVQRLPSFSSILGGGGGCPPSSGGTDPVHHDHQHLPSSSSSATASPERQASVEPRQQEQRADISGSPVGHLPKRRSSLDQGLLQHQQNLHPIAIVCDNAGHSPTNQNPLGHQDLPHSGPPSVNGYSLQKRPDVAGLVLPGSHGGNDVDGGARSSLTTASEEVKELLLMELEGARPNESVMVGGVRQVHSMPCSPLSSALLGHRLSSSTSVKNAVSGSVSVGAKAGDAVGATETCCPTERTSCEEESAECPQYEAVAAAALLDSPPAIATATTTTTTTTCGGSTMSISSSGDPSHFLSDLESVLGDSSSFSLASALNTDHHIRLKSPGTPDKLLMKSIPPSSIMKPKSSHATASSRSAATATTSTTGSGSALRRADHHHHHHHRPRAQKPLVSSGESPAKGGVVNAIPVSVTSHARTDFLGALKENSSGVSSAAKAAAASVKAPGIVPEEPSQMGLANQDDSHDNPGVIKLSCVGFNLAGGGGVDVAHDSSSSHSNSNDSLSKLFNDNNGCNGSGS